MRLQISLALSVLFAAAVAAQPSVSGYTTEVRHGFPVLVLDAGLANHPVEMQAAVSELDAQLSAIVQANLSEAVMERLRAVKIFVDWAQTNGGAQYHPSRQWLLDNGYEPEKEQSVEISNARNFVAWSQQNQPWMVLHELSHAYHHQVLGYNDAAILGAYQNAVRSGLLDSVPYNPGGGRAHFNQVAYAKNNEIEYFAEISEAYLGENDYYPFVRSELEAYDPQGFAVAQSVWAPATTATDQGPFAVGVQVYPNPFLGPLTVEVERPAEIVVFDALGRAVVQRTVESGRTTLDLGSVTPGLYVLRATDPSGVAFRSIVRGR